MQPNPVVPQDVTTQVPKTFFAVTFGCQMNRHDSERIAGALAQRGLVPADKMDRADAIIFNTCCVREHAEERFYGRLTQLASLKRANPDLVIAVTGCVAEKDGEGVFARAPYVDLVVGTGATAAVGQLVMGQLEGDRARVCMLDPSETIAAELPALRESPVHGWMSIMTGCDNFCSYCIVPHVRGGERSRPVRDILTEAERMAADGVLDVTLLGQNVNSYGRDLYGAPRFAELLGRLDGSGIERIRFTTSHPKDLCEETIGVMASSAHVCRHIHLPMQSGSSAVLSEMNRCYTKEDYMALVERIRLAMPDVALSTDIMVGFPGETEDDFKDTLEVVERSGFDQAFTFIFSRRKGTSAADMAGQVEERTKRDRFVRLAEAVAASALRANEAYVGRAVQVLVEGPSAKDPSRLSGRTRTNKLIHFEGPPQLIHTFVEVQVTSARTWCLEGSLPV